MSRGPPPSSSRRTTRCRPRCSTAPRPSHRSPSTRPCQHARHQAAARRRRGTSAHVRLFWGTWPLSTDTTVSPCSGVALCRVVPKAVNETSRKVSQYLEKAPIRNTLTVSPPEIGILVYNDDNQWVVWVSKTFYQWLTNIPQILWKPSRNFVASSSALYRVVPVSRSSHPSIRRGSNSKCHKLFHNKNRLNGAGVWYCLERRLGGGYITVRGGAAVKTI